jgi:hypothetical protein
MDFSALGAPSINCAFDFCFDFTLELGSVLVGIGSLSSTKNTRITKNLLLQRK